ncbi:hypothetical protein GYMLUDRAFT_252741 [Collybiopsis luxurians FD-317 M1]|uniref:Unplaced genomic scaffold GYMLUscaffold_140, whole genome shotgun sequence n=1 Tax=Collybiopsis luxurians FD-317 M1 TaxID=944289 RepID=A0A0D0C7G2_9AGAR|nr:hypothetical protein GYMLUDRAFT_252741 [Collybiopsis luxurians FD-317 M1]
MPTTNLPIFSGDDIFLPDLHCISYDPNEVNGWTITNSIASPKTVWHKDDTFMVQLLHHSVALTKGWNVPILPDYLPIAATINLVTLDMLKFQLMTMCKDNVTPFHGEGHISYSCLWSKDEYESEAFQLFDAQLISDAGKTYPHPTSL